MIECPPSQLEADMCQRVKSGCMIWDDKEFALMILMTLLVLLLLASIIPVPLRCPTAATVEVIIKRTQATSGDDMISDTYGIQDTSEKSSRRSVRVPD
jgi:hypothetical protein